MVLSIKNEEADRLARQLAATTGETVTAAVVNALRERLEREQTRRTPSLRERLARLAEDVQALPILDDRSADEILGYDDHGLPT
jgi:antitoxin VapB